MEWIVYGFMGTLALIVLLIIGIGLYRANWGKGKDMPNQGVRMQGGQTQMPNRPDRFE